MRLRRGARNGAPTAKTGDDRFHYSAAGPLRGSPSGKTAPGLVTAAPISQSTLVVIETTTISVPTEANPERITAAAIAFGVPMCAADETIESRAMRAPPMHYLPKCAQFPGAMWPTTTMPLFITA